MSTAHQCPACRDAHIRPHCDSHTCPWYRCVKPLCAAVIDYAANRGYRVTGGTTISLTLEGP